MTWFLITYCTFEHTQNPNRYFLILYQKYSPKEHKKQSDSTQILSIRKGWNLEGSNHADGKGHWDQIYDL